VVKKAPGPAAKKRRGDAFLGWHNSMLGALLGSVHADLQWVYNHIRVEQHSKPRRRRLRFAAGGGAAGRVVRPFIP